MDALDRLFTAMHDGLTDAVHFAGPWALPALPALGVGALLLVVVKRDRIVSAAGAVVLLALAALAVIVRAIQPDGF